MAENVVNPNEEQMYVQGADDQSDEYEYEYVELGEGEELPEGVEYEYIEVSDDEEAAMPSISVQTPQAAPVQPQAAPVEPEPQLIPEPILSAPVQPQAVPVQPQVSHPEMIHNAPVAPVVSRDPYAQASAVAQPQTVAPAPEPSPILAEPAHPMAQSIVEEDLNALLDDNDEIKEVDTADLLNDTENDFEHQLFSAGPVDGVEEVSIEDILGAGEEHSLSGFFIEDGVEEVSADELLRDMKPDADLMTPKFEKTTETIPVFENEPVFEIAAPGEEAKIEEVTPQSEAEMLGGTEDQVWLNDDAGVDVGDTAAPEIESIAEVGMPLQSEAISEAPQMIAEPEVIEEEAVVAVPQVVEAEPMVEISPVMAEPESEVVSEAEVISELDIVQEMPSMVSEPEQIEEPVIEKLPEVSAPEAVVAEIPEPILAAPITPAVVTPATIEPEVVVAPVMPVAEIPEPILAAPIMPVIETPKPVLTPPSSPMTVRTKEIVQVAYGTKLLDEVARAELAVAAKTVDNNSGLQFFELAGGSILLNAQAEELSAWHLIIFNQNLVPVEMPHRHAEIAQKPDTIRLTNVVRQGNEKLEVYNEEEYDFADPADGFVKAQKHFIYGRVADDTGLIVNDFVNVDVRLNAGKVISFDKPVFGWLSGPNGAQVYFAQLKTLAISAPEQVSEDEEKAHQKAAKWYSGSVDDKYFEFSLESQSGEFVGTEALKNIHVNIGTSSYGWNVTFDNGLVMSLKDLQEFETKHGKMPSANGEIIHGALKLKFSNVDRIVVYQTPQYFAYGKN